jgi:DNA-binding NarL/FixJ family response regulator
MDTQTKFESIALPLIARGFAVTPLNGKAPFLSGTDFSCSSDAEQIRLWAVKYPSSNAGVVMVGQDYWALDVDELDWFMDNCHVKLPDTLVVLTGSGKLHIYFKGKRPAWLKTVVNPRFKSKTETPDEPAKFLEYPNQCVAPGSVHPSTGKEYSVYKDAPLAECPQDFLEWLRGLNSKTSVSVSRGLNPLQKGIDIERVLADAGLRFDKFQGDGKVFFNYHAYQDCLVKSPDSHVGPGEDRNPRQCAFVLNTKNNEFWHQCFSAGCQVQGKTRIALKELGIELESVVVPYWRQLFKSKGQLNQDPLLFVVERFVPEGITGIGGPSGHGKTWMMLSMAKAIRKGDCMLWGQFKVSQPYEILYMTPEVGDRGINHRLTLLGLQDDEGFLLRTQSMGSRLELDRPELIAAAKGKVVFLDTMVRWLAGREENSSKDMAQLFELMMDMLSAGAVSIIFAHHSVKGSKTNPWTMTAECVFRGSGDIIANLSAGHGVYQLSYQEPDKTLLHVECVKPRDFEPAGPFQLQALIGQRQDLVMTKEPGVCGHFHEEKKAYSAEPADERLTAIQTALAAGRTKPEIAAEMGIDVRTINRILQKAAVSKKEESEPVDSTAPLF